MEIELLKELYSKEAVLKTIHVFSNDFSISIESNERSFILNVKSSTDNFFDEALFMKKLQEQQLKETLNSQFGELRKAIYNKAFSLVE